MSLPTHMHAYTSSFSLPLPSCQACVNKTNAQILCQICHIMRTIHARYSTFSSFQTCLISPCGFLFMFVPSFTSSSNQESGYLTHYDTCTTSDGCDSLRVSKTGISHDCVHPSYCIAPTCHTHAPIYTFCIHESSQPTVQSLIQLSYLCLLYILKHA